METKTLKRSLFQRLLGICATQPPADAGCWSVSGGRIKVDLGRARELASPGGAIRLEKKNPPVRVLVIHGDDGQYHAFENKCLHGGRRLDPVPGGGTVQCCSIGKATYDYEGKLLSGPDKGNARVLAAQVEGGKIVVTL